MNNKIVLSTLNLQNFATFENQSITFLESFNAIVGETGSGKSLILDALQLVFGARADKTLIRKGSSFATIEATFLANDDTINKYFTDLGFPYEDEITIKRVIFDNGRTKSYLNHQSCSVSTLTAFSRDFVDLVGQFENQKLLSEDYQLTLLDSYSGITKDVIEYHNSYTKYQKLLNQLTELQEKKNQRSQREDFIDFQLKEIEQLSPSLEDETNLLNEKDELIGRQSKKELLNSSLMILSNDEQSNLTNTLRSLITTLERDGEAISNDDLSKLHGAYQLLEEVSYNLSKEVDDECQDARLNEIVDRLDDYQRLKRKFGGSIEQLIESYQSFQQEYEELKSLDAHIEQIQSEINSMATLLTTLAHTIHKTRNKKAQELSKKLTEGVRQLMMVGATVKLEVSESEKLGPFGITDLNFIAETNPGEGYHPIKKAASGGELSRILLTLRQVIASSESISVFLFDEIDTGIGGETAVCTGKALQKVSTNSQVIAITHLPQIANFADKLINVTKIVADRTYSAINEYTDKDKNDYVIKMSQLN